MSLQLLVVRHAKTEPTASSDSARVLTDRGRRQSDALGLELRTLDLGNVRAIVSSAARARETWELAAAHLESVSLTTEVLDSLYVADVEDVLEEVRLTGAGFETVVVVGHNPTIEDLVWELADDVVTPAVETLRASGYSPSTTTRFELSGDWTTVDRGVATLTRYIGPLA